MRRSLLILAGLMILVPSIASAHKTWLLPSQTIFSGTEPLVTFDAAVSNDLFYFNHFPLPLENLQVTAPDGTAADAENQATLRYRSVFDVPLKQSGTYKIAIVRDGLFGSWEEDGKRRRWRGTAETFAKEVPADAKNLQVTESIGRIESYVTNGAPTKDVFQPTGKGIELLPVTHPNDLYVGEQATFQFLVEGKPMPGLELEIICGGIRYRDSQEEIHVTTDSDGYAKITWPKPGMYWLETTLQDDKSQVGQASNRRLSFVGTFEVLPQ